MTNRYTNETLTPLIDDIDQLITDFTVRTSQSFFSADAGQVPGGDVYMPTSILHAWSYPHLKGTEFFRFVLMHVPLGQELPILGNPVKLLHG